MPVMQNTHGYKIVKNHPNLKRDGLNINSAINVSYLQAILGDTIEVETVDGPHPLTIPIGTQPSAVLVLENKGIPKLGNPVARGDHCIQINVSLPSKLSDEERILLEKLASHYSSKGLQNHHQKSGLFERMFGKND